MQREIMQIIPADGWHGEFLIKKGDVARRNTNPVFKRIVCWALVSDKSEGVKQHVVGMIVNDNKLEFVDMIDGFMGYERSQNVGMSTSEIVSVSKIDGGSSGT